MRDNGEHGVGPRRSSGTRSSALWGRGGRGLAPAVLSFLCAAAAVAGVAIGKGPSSSGNAANHPSASAVQRLTAKAVPASWASVPDRVPDASWASGVDDG